MAAFFYSLLLIAVAFVSFAAGHFIGMVRMMTHLKKDPRWHGKAVIEVEGGEA